MSQLESITLRELQRNLNWHDPIVYGDMLKGKSNSLLLDKVTQISRTGGFRGSIIPREKFWGYCYHNCPSVINCVEWIIQKLVDSNNTLKDESEIFQRNIRDTLKYFCDYLAYLETNLMQYFAYSDIDYVLQTIGNMETPRQEFLRLFEVETNENSYIRIHISEDRLSKEYRLRKGYNDVYSKRRN